MSLALVMTTLLGITLSPPSATRTWSDSFPVGVPASVRVRTNDASVRVTTRESGPVVVVVRHAVRSWGWNSGIKDPAVSLRREGEEVVVEADIVRGTAVFGGFTREFTIDVTMPSKGRLSVRSGDGRITCEPLEGDIRLETGDGSIRVNGLKGRISLSSGDGRVVGEDLDGDVTARSGDGRIRLEGRFDRLEARTADGSVAVTAAAGSQAQAAWNLETQDGSVSLLLPRDFAALLDARMGDGRILVNLPIRVPANTRRTLTGQLNGGSVPLRLRTSDGTITLGLSTP